MNLNCFPIAFAPGFGKRDLLFTGKVLSRQRIFAFKQGFRGSCKNGFTAMNSCAGAKVHNIVG